MLSALAKDTNPKDTNHLARHEPTRLGDESDPLTLIATATLRGSWLCALIATNPSKTQQFRVCQKQTFFYENCSISHLDGRKKLFSSHITHCIQIFI
jgi:hypothetical protein